MQGAVACLRVVSIAVGAVQSHECPRGPMGKWTWVNRKTASERDTTRYIRTQSGVIPIATVGPTDDGASLGASHSIPFRVWVHISDCQLARDAGRSGLSRGRQRSSQGSSEP